MERRGVDGIGRTCQIERIEKSPSVRRGSSTAFSQRRSAPRPPPTATSPGRCQRFAPRRLFQGRRTGLKRGVFMKDIGCVNCLGAPSLELTGERGALEPCHGGHAISSFDMTTITQGAGLRISHKQMEHMSDDAASTGAPLPGTLRRSPIIRAPAKTGRHGISIWREVKGAVGAGRVSLFTASCQPLHRGTDDARPLRATVVVSKILWLAWAARAFTLPALAGGCR